jgi:hypothetical protein
MTIEEMAAEAKKHWRQYPAIYRKMQRRKVLDKEAIAAAKLTQREMKALMRVGATEEDAYQDSCHLFILTDPAKNYRL